MKIRLCDDPNGKLLVVGTTMVGGRREWATLHWGTWAPGPPTFSYYPHFDMEIAQLPGYPDGVLQPNYGSGGYFSYMLVTETDEDTTVKAQDIHIKVVLAHVQGSHRVNMVVV